MISPVLLAQWQNTKKRNDLTEITYFVSILLITHLLFPVSIQLHSLVRFGMQIALKVWTSRHAIVIPLQGRIVIQTMRRQDHERVQDLEQRVVRVASLAPKNEILSSSFILHQLLKLGQLSRQSFCDEFFLFPRHFVFLIDQSSVRSAQIGDSVEDHIAEGLIALIRSVHFVFSGQMTQDGPGLYNLMVAFE